MYSLWFKNKIKNQESEVVNGFTVYENTGEESKHSSGQYGCSLKELYGSIQT